MPPRKAPKSTTVAAPLRPPNTSHPCYSHLASSLADLPMRPHSASYHVFFDALPGPSTTRASSPPPKKKQKKKSEEKLAGSVEGAWKAERIQKKLVKWFDERREDRKMPWRSDVVPSEMSRKERSQRGYEVWVSEIMLQQTQVATVISYFERWVEKFPTVIALSKASIDEVNAVWTGLGYYSRAKRLLEGAQTVVKNSKGLVPETVEELLTIEGIGPYSAGAISSIAFGNRSALVDGNVTRVFSRLTALHAPATAKSTTSFIWALADHLVPDNVDSSESEGQKIIKNRPGSWNQGLMELGATVCTPKNPKCGECPISEECLGYQEARFVAHKSKSKQPTSPAAIEVDLEDLCTLCSPLPAGDDDLKAHGVEIYPMAKERKKQREEETAVCLVEWESSEDTEGDDEKARKKDRKVLVMKRPEKGLLAGLLEFPSVDLPPSSESTPSTRSKHLTSLLQTLLPLSSSFLLSASTSSPTDADDELKIKSFKSVEPPVVHVYSHIIRTYHILHLVLTSPSLPKLRSSPLVVDKSTSSSKSTKKKKPKKPSSEDDEEDAEGTEAGKLVQSLPGTGKWIDSTAVEGESLGGAMFKVWELARNGGGATASRKNGKGATGGKGKGGGKKEASVEKGQKSLMGFFGGGGGGTGKKTQKEEEEDDEIVIVEDGKTAEREEKKVYKKRRIAPTSDEEDEE
ncbi:A/G-specific adenine glycosylase [Sporobolomyces salmoneus]|uniref:A/G-specific adenine glycosylase n=1 Tax=Sporobolomyces salmoneus TaxID=183962 RepID=UPI003180DD56